MVLPVVGQALVERTILLGSDLAWVTSPERLSLVELFICCLGFLDLLLGLLFLVFFIINFFDLGLLGIFSLFLIIFDLLEYQNFNQ